MFETTDGLFDSAKDQGKDRNLIGDGRGRIEFVDQDPGYSVQRTEVGPTDFVVGDRDPEDQARTPVDVFAVNFEVHYFPFAISSAV